MVDSSGGRAVPDDGIDAMGMAYFVYVALIPLGYSHFAVGSRPRGTQADANPIEESNDP
jgi:hypothetical protein